MKNIIGVYEYNSLNPYTNSNYKIELLLNMDSTFQYVEKAENYYPDTIKGLWKIEGKRIFFNPIEYYYFYPCETCEKSRIFVFNKHERLPLDYAHIKLFRNSKLINELFTNEDGMASLDSDFDSLSVHYIGFKSIGFMFDDNTINIVEVYLESVIDIEKRLFIYKKNNIIMFYEGEKRKIKKISNVSN
ncbi:MAG TPA: hypothetical protein PLF32_05565 [Bacteroidales bacterium]|nr:hypothetical protein [Bacteroidales bacterium]HOR82103.1 hypothetical protein [Bacteroidales bacterium]HPJ90434.1 hypothetical protein [Bacteroidales bacterium]